VKAVPAKSVLEAAREFLARGWLPIPVEFRSKRPTVNDWPNIRPSGSRLSDLFRTGPSNIGLLLGEPSSGLVDVDLDAPKAVLLADAFLPKTGMVHGRHSKPRSHFWYVTNPPPKTRRLEDPDGTVLVELRSTGCQTIVPPSTHPEGELVAWCGGLVPATIDPELLMESVGVLAACALVSQHWPQTGGRHGATLALAGGLLRAGWPIEKVEGFVTAAARAAGDEEWRDRARDVRSSAARLTAARETTGWPKLRDLIGSEVVDRLRLFLEIPLVSVSSNFGVSSKLVWPGPPEPEAFYGLAGDIVRAIEPHTEADPVAVLIQVLVAFGNVIGRRPHFRVEGDHHHTNIFAVLVGITSKGRKGTSWGQACLPFSTLDAGWINERVVSGLSSGEGLIWAVRDEIKRQDVVKAKGRVVGYETVIADPGVADKRLLALEPEFASLLQVMSRQGNTVSPIIRRAYETGNLRSLTKNSPAVATGAHISIIGHITRKELLRNLERTEAANGFANRFLWLCVRRSKSLPRGGRIGQVDFAPIVRSLAAAVDFARNVDEITRDENAWEAWERVYDDLSAGHPGLLGAVLSRAEAQVTRLACLYALLDQSNVVRREHMVAALALWEYCEASCRFIFGDTLGDPDSDEILHALRARQDGMTRTEIRDLFGRNKSAGQIGRSLQGLAEQGLAMSREEKTEGRPVERWFAIRLGETLGTTKTTETT
jgi:Bifunctional DNA primase/polymerase, N-terminal